MIRSKTKIKNDVIVLGGSSPWKIEFKNGRLVIKNDLSNISINLILFYKNLFCLSWNLQIYDLMRHNSSAI